MRASEFKHAPPPNYSTKDRTKAILGDTFAEFALCISPAHKVSGNVFKWIKTSPRGEYRSYTRYIDKEAFY